MNTILIYLTTRDKKEAESISKTLIDEKLIACANIIDNMTSVYRWKEKLNQESECIVFLKTKKELFDSVRLRICELHSYDTPCILKINISDGHAPYLSWINENL